MTSWTGKMSTVKCILKEDNNVVIKDLEYDSDAQKFITTILPNEFLTEDEIALDLLNRLSIDDLTYMCNMEREAVIMMHHGFGTSIRNEYGLWYEENPYTVLDDAMADNFPDQVSHRILEKMWDTLNLAGRVSKTPLTAEQLYDQAMKVVDEDLEDKK